MCCVLWLCQSLCVDVRVHFLLWAGGVASALQRVGTLCGRRSIHPEMQPPRRYREDLKLCVRRPLRDASIIFPSFFLFTFCSCSLLPHPLLFPRVFCLSTNWTQPALESGKTFQNMSSDKPNTPGKKNHYMPLRTRLSDNPIA